MASRERPIPAVHPPSPPVHPPRIRLRSQRRRILACLLAVGVLAVAARFSVPVPGSPIPTTLQSLAVLLTGALLGPRLGAGSLFLYLLVGALGLPVFADGGSGWARLSGPSAGYFAGFLVAGVGMGWAADRGRLRSFWPAALAFGLGHLVILLLGGAWLAAKMGPWSAWQSGVAPFLWGGALKSLAGAMICVAWPRRWR